MDTWPGIWPAPESNDWQEARELRHAAIAVLTGNATRTTHSALDQRLDNVAALLRAIENAQYRVEELRHGPIFRDQVKAVPTYVPAGHEPLRALLERVSRLPKIDRSALYTAIEMDDGCSTDLERQAKSIIDGLYSRAVAYSLEEKLLSVEREVPLGGIFHAGGKPDPGEISVATFDPEDTAGSALEAIVIKWEDIFYATQFFVADSHREPTSRSRWTSW